ncbi:hypothetical protein OE88DRAFT_1651844 [Heliocybe sulcata]|uniref:Uncharacterized protein n=1 Tax=Heliocybe sulcata TaxID=5364 RepID=A0A5C3NCS3_9AGAM|nr:hypothetical protein OE88DRAFT_1651844 [Heliocybe sulcata]
MNQGPRSSTVRGVHLDNPLSISSTATPPSQTIPTWSSSCNASTTVVSEPTSQGPPSAAL